MKLYELKEEAFSIAKANGWHDIDYPDSHWLMLVITEISEAIEAECGNYDNDYEPGSGECGACSICDHCKDDESRDYPAIARYTSPHWGFMCNFVTGEYRHFDELFDKSK